MSNGGKVYEVKCPSCGAPLHMSGERITCNYCGAVLERERPIAQEQAPSSPDQDPHVIVIQTGYSTISGQRKSGGAACMSVLFTFLLIGCIFGAAGWFLFQEQLSTLSGLAGLSDVANLGQLPEQIINKASITSLNRVILLPSDNDASSDFLTFTYQSSGSTYALTYVDALSSTIRWQGPPLKEWYNTKILPAPERLYFTDETKLYAVNRSNGQAAWQTSLADTLAPSCLNCFELIDNALVALLQGGTVQGFDAGTGQLMWNKRLNFTAINRINTIGGQLLIFDRSLDNRDELMFVVNPANGEVAGEITIPECGGEGFDQYHPILFNPSRGEAHFIFGDIIGPVCIQTWNVAAQQMTREIVLEGTALPSNFREYNSEQRRATLVGDMLYFAANEAGGNGDQGMVIAVNMAEGTWRPITATPDYQLIPLTMADNVLIVRAIRSRGTARSELWGLDLVSDEPRWQYVLQAPRWFKETGSGGAWDWHLTSQGLAVLQIFGDPDQLTIETLNPQTGVSSGQKTIPLDDDYFSDIVWTNDAAWLAFRQIYKVDLQTGTLSYTWP